MRGETVESLVTGAEFSVEQILSGTLDAPVEYRQDHDEWVVVLTGGAVLFVDGGTISLAAGEWLLLPGGTSHRLDSTVPGTSWLAVRGPRPGSTVASPGPPPESAPAG